MPQSAPSPTPPVQRPASATSAVNSFLPVGRVPALSILFIGLFGVLLTSFPARNLDVWRHLAGGRDLFHGGGFSSTWLYDLGTYVVFSLAGGTGLAAAKAILCGSVAVLMLRLGSVAGWRLALAVTGLAMLAMSTRLLLQPQTVSVACLAVALWLVYRQRRTPANSFWPDWRLALLFTLWANLDHWFVLGLAVVAVTRFGQCLDSRCVEKFGRSLGRWAVSVGVLTAVSCLSVPPVLGLWEAVGQIAREGELSTVHSPFDPNFVTLFRDNSSALAYYPLLVLGAISFLLNRREWRWGHCLPWVGLAVLSGLEARAVPFFAVLAGPVTAWNLQGYFSRRQVTTRQWVRYVGVTMSGVVSLAFLVAAWPGWLQAPPFEPRRWAVDDPSAIARGADRLSQTHAAGVWQPSTRTLHLSQDTLGAFAWFCPQDGRLRDDIAVGRLLDYAHPEEARERLRELRVTRVVVSAADPDSTSKAVEHRLLSDPTEWRILSVWGGVVVFGWLDPASGTPNPFVGWEVDFERLAFAPDESEMAPATGPGDDRHWWEAFCTPAPSPRPPGRDEAAVLLRRAEAKRPYANYHHMTDWDLSQLAGLVGAAGGWTGPGCGADAALRLTLFRPPLPADERVRLPAVTEMTVALKQKFAADRGQIPVGDVYVSVRAARRAAAENPTDAPTYRLLAQGYATLIGYTAEQGWAGLVPHILQIRQIQAAAALNRAVTLNPRLAQAHLDLARLYRDLQCLDLAVQHLRAYRDLPPLSGGPQRGPATEALTAELEEWTKLLDSRTRTFEQESTRTSVSDRAQLAVQLELGGRARDLLLKSDVSAFGAEGAELELDLLLRTGRPNDVLEWTSPEVRGSLGELKFRWTRARAFLAVGNYDAADQELREMVGPGGQLPTPASVGEEVAPLVGKCLIDSQPTGGQLNQPVWIALSHNDLQNHVSEIARTIGLQADITTLRGVLALEAGNIPRAREAFQSALVFSPNRAGCGQLDFRGRRVARDGLSLTGQGGLPHER